MAKLRLLQFSDFHVAKNAVLLRTQLRKLKVPGATPWDRYALRHAANKALEIHQREPVDAILLTGDLADTGATENLEHAKEAVGLSGNHGQWTTLSQLGPQLIVLPGNHDRYQARRWGWSPGNRRFDHPQHFGDHWQKGLSGVQTWPFPDQKVPNFVLIGVDLCLASILDAPPGWHLGQGRVRRHHLEKLQKRTLAAQTQRAAVVWLTHFAPVFPFSNAFDRRFLHLVAGKLLLERAYSHNVKLLLCGHTHSTRRYREVTQPGRLSGIEVVCCGASCCQFDGATFLEITVETDENAHLTNLTVVEWHRKAIGGEFQDRILTPQP